MEEGEKRLQEEKWRREEERKKEEVRRKEEERRREEEERQHSNALAAAARAAISELLLSVAACNRHRDLRRSTRTLEARCRRSLASTQRARARLSALTLQSAVRRALQGDKWRREEAERKEEERRKEERESAAALQAVTRRAAAAVQRLEVYREPLLCKAPFVQSPFCASGFYGLGQRFNVCGAGC
eukprot:2597094-Rhodomonas_salina.4